MKLIERLTQDYNNGLFNAGVKMNEISMSTGNRYNYIVDDNLYISFKQTERAHYDIFLKFMNDHDVKIIDITKRKDMWNDNYRVEHGYNSRQLHLRYLSTLTGNNL